MYQLFDTSTNPQARSRNYKVHDECFYQIQYCASGIGFLFPFCRRPVCKSPRYTHTAANTTEGSSNSFRLRHHHWKTPESFSKARTSPPSSSSELLLKLKLSRRRLVTSQTLLAFTRTAATPEPTTGTVPSAYRQTSQAALLLFLPSAGTGTTASRRAPSAPMPRSPISASRHLIRTPCTCWDHGPLKARPCCLLTPQFPETWSFCRRWRGTFSKSSVLMGQTPRRSARSETLTSPPSYLKVMVS